MMQEITFDIFIESTAASTLLITGASGIHRLMEANIYAENYIYRQTAERFSDVNVVHGAASLLQLRQTSGRLPDR